MEAYRYVNRKALVSVTPSGLYCEAGGFFIDPWRPVDRAVITHAHGDHARTGSERYLGAAPGESLLRKRLNEPTLEVLPYGEQKSIGDVTVSFHPAGHVLGSSQIRIEHKGEVWVVSGDYKRDPDPTCEPFEVVRCDTFITEATFGLPIYRWDPTSEIAEDIRRWWVSNREKGKSSVLFCYALGKAQRILAELAKLTDEGCYVHGATQALVNCYRDAGIAMIPTQLVSEVEKGTSFEGALVLAPPSAGGSTWMRRFGEYETGFASGWMRVRGNRRRRGFDRGFVVSDHADWRSLLQTVADTEATQVLVTHGSSETLSHHLRDIGVNAMPLDTHFQGEAED